MLVRGIGGPDNDDEGCILPMGGWVLPEEGPVRFADEGYNGLTPWTPEFSDGADPGRDVAFNVFGKGGVELADLELVSPASCCPAESGNCPEMPFKGPLWMPPETPG